MDYIVVAILTIATSFVILGIIRRSESVSLNSTSYRQSDMHTINKRFFPKNLFKNKKPSQMIERIEKNKIKIIAIDDRAYWVVDNVFYSADLIDDHPDMSTAEPIDTSRMSKHDIDKMLFILDNLDRGKKNERGSTGNE